MLGRSFEKLCAACGGAMPVDTSICPECQQAQPQAAPDRSFSQTYRPTGLSIMRYVVSTEPPQPAQAMPYLEVVEGGTVGRRFPLSRASILIGRWDPELEVYPEVDLSEEDNNASISRCHARIVDRGNGFELVDCESRNGTYLNEEVRLIPGYGYPLRDGDRIRIGWLMLRFCRPAG